MPSCETCWRDADGNAERYAKLVQERRCTPEEQAGKDSGTCYVCGRRTMHPHAHVCMNPSCVSNAPHDGRQRRTVDGIVGNLDSGDA